MGTSFETIDWDRYYEVEAQTRRFVPEHDPAEAERTAFALSLLPRGQLGRILEVGSGDGYLASTMAPRGVVTCVDLVRQRVHRSIDRAGGTGVVARAEELPFASGAFDIVTMVEVLEHLPDLPRALNEIRRVGLGGVLVLTVPFEQKIPRVLCPSCHVEFPVDGHLHSFSAQKLHALLTEHGLQPLRIAVHRPEPVRRWESIPPLRWLGPSARLLLKRALRRAGILDTPPGRYLGAVVSLDKRLAP